eukprot:2731503-Rhodomonas_salina.1
MARSTSRQLLAALAGTAACIAVLALVVEKGWGSQPTAVSLLSKSQAISKIDKWETTTLAHSWEGEHAEHARSYPGKPHTSIRTTGKVAEAKAMQQMERANARSQRQAAHKDEKKATKLVGFAKKLAQKIVAREAVDEMRQWLQAHPPAPPKPKAKVAQKPAAPAKRKVVQAAAPAPKPAAPKTEEQIMKEDFRSWQSKKLRGYARENSMFTAQEFCNSRTVTAHPSVKDLKASFGDDWRNVAARHPRVASMAAVTSCLQSLGLADSRLQPVPRKAWTEGALKGKEGAVTLCAAGDEDACSELAKDKTALAGLKNLLPAH